ncbi:MAG TPA: hypothetical protein VMD53_03890, partial [Rhizomicrobium sp.]|nr:hypothetical protein [Rhizomicrobium sp.]
MLSKLEEQRSRQELFRREILRRYKTCANYLRELVVVDISSPTAKTLKGFYALYSRVFTLEEEREPIEGFERVLSLNEDSETQTSFGPLREQITAAIDPASG